MSLINRTVLIVVPSLDPVHPQALAAGKALKDAGVNVGFVDFASATGFLHKNVDALVFSISDIDQALAICDPAARGKPHGFLQIAGWIPLKTHPDHEAKVTRLCSLGAIFSHNLEQLVTNVRS